MGADKGKSKDAAFLKEAAMGSMAEVEMGRVAQQHASNDAVKQFAQRMVTDHGKELTELKSLAQSKGVDLPTELDKKHREMAEKMAKLSGEEFDRAYARDMLADHRKDVKEFQTQAEKASDPDVKSFAAKQVLVLEEHLSMAERLPGNDRHKSAPIAAREGHHNRPHSKPDSK